VQKGTRSRDNCVDLAQEAYLKVMVSPDERFISNFKTLMPSANNDELIKMMIIRGFSIQKQQDYIAAYNSTVADEDKISSSVIVPENKLSRILTSISHNIKK